MSRVKPFSSLLIALALYLASMQARASLVSYEWDWTCAWNCGNVGLLYGESVTGRVVTEGEAPPTPTGSYQLAFRGVDVVSYSFTIGNRTLDEANTTIGRWTAFFPPLGPANTFTGGDLVGIVELYYFDGNRAFHLFDDSDVVWQLDPDISLNVALATAAGPLPRLSDDDWRGAYPGGWHFAGSVPEPATSVLLCIALLISLIASRRISTGVHPKAPSLTLN